MSTKTSSSSPPLAVTRKHQSDSAVAGRRISHKLGPGPSSILIGASGFLLVLLLRISGVIVGPKAIVLAVICLILAPGPRRLSERFIVYFSIGFGWLALLGWIPRLETTIDVPGVLLALAFGLAAANQFHNGRARFSLPQQPRPTEIAALTIGAMATLWWAVPFLRLNLSGRLSALIPGWDNAAFFDLFRQILLHGSFRSIRTPGPGEGLPQTWALLIRIWSPHPPTTTYWVLNAYEVALLLTLGAIVTLGCMSVARLCRNEFWLALPAMAVVVTVFVVGRLWVFNGYPTFDLPIAAIAAAILVSWRATLSPRMNFFTVAGLVLVAAYTWYPIVVLGAPALTATTLRWVRASGRFRAGHIAGLACTGIAYLGPLIHFSNDAGKFSLSYASSGVNASAVWTPGTPWVLLVLSVVTLLATAVVRWFRLRDGSLGLLAVPALIGALGVVFLVASEYSASHHVSYYGHKWAAGVAGMSLLVLVTVLMASFATGDARRRMPNVVTAVLACLGSVVLLEIDGYVGPSANANEKTLAQGFSSHKYVSTPAINTREAGQLIESAQYAEDRSASDARWAVVDPDGSINCGLADEWFYALSNELFIIRYYGDWNYFPCRIAGGDSATADYLVSAFPNPIASRIHLFVPSSLAQEIIARNPAWNSPGVLNILK